MNLKALSDTVLLEQTEKLVQRERELLTEILYHLREIERRRLFSQLGFRSLFEYAVKRLGYADDQAGRRISAMRLLQEFPQIESKIANGNLTLSNLSMAQVLFRKAKKGEVQSSSGVGLKTGGGETLGFNKEEKLALLEKLENKSKREAEKIIFTQLNRPEMLKPDRIRPLSENTIEIKFVADTALQAKLSKVKGLLAHSYPAMSLADTVDLLCDFAIKKLDPAKKSLNSKAPSIMPTQRCVASAPELKQCAIGQLSLSVGKRKIAAHVRRQVWKMAQSQCQNCGSRYALQVDHIRPLALGGTHDLNNLRLLCRACNQRAAIEKLGLNKMQRHLES